MDYEKIAAAAVQGIKTAGLNRFLRVSGFVLANPELKIVCALVSDLYCPGYNPSQPLEKSSNLACTATRYKVESAKIGTGVRVELSSKTSQSVLRRKIPPTNNK